MRRITRGVLTLVAALCVNNSVPGQGLDKDRQENRKFQQRRQTRLNELRDETGQVRPDLWKKGVDHYRKMEFAAGVSRARKGGKPTTGDARLADASPAAGGGGVQGVQWRQLGPQPAFPIASINFQGNGPMSGQVTDIAIEPRGSTDQVIYIATNDGGIWKSMDGGATFRQKTDYMPSISMGAVSVDPVSPWDSLCGHWKPV